MPTRNNVALPLLLCLIIQVCSRLRACALAHARWHRCGATCGGGTAIDVLWTGWDRLLALANLFLWGIHFLFVHVPRSARLLPSCVCMCARPARQCVRVCVCVCIAMSACVRFRASA